LQEREDLRLISGAQCLKELARRSSTPCIHGPYHGAPAAPCDDALVGRHRLGLHIRKRPSMEMCSRPPQSSTPTLVLTVAPPKPRIYSNMHQFRGTWPRQRPHDGRTGRAGSAPVSAYFFRGIAVVLVVDGVVGRAPAAGIACKASGVAVNPALRSLRVQPSFGPVASFASVSTAARARLPGWDAWWSCRGCWSSSHRRPS
jgi:hypothetical protein